MNQKMKYIGLLAILPLAMVALAPPLNNHQTLGLAFATAWLAFMAHRKNRV